MTDAIALSHAAVSKFNSMDFCGMTPREIAAWYRKEICPAHNAVAAMQKEHDDLFKGRYGSTQAIRHQLVIDRIEYRMTLVMARRDKEIEAAAARSHNRIAA